MREYLVIIEDSFCQFCISCDPSSEPSYRDHSDEGSQQMVSLRNNKNYSEELPLINYHQILSVI